MKQDKIRKGSLRDRGNGLLELRVYCAEKNGVRKRMSFYGHSESECYERANRFIYEQEVMKSGVDLRATIPDLLRGKFDHDFNMNHVTEAAYDRNMMVTRIIEKSPLGEIPIVDIEEKDLEKFLMSITNYANNSIEKIYYQLKTAYRIALEDKIIEKNLMDSRKLQRRPKSVKPDKIVKGFTVEEQKRFMKVLDVYKVPRWRSNDYKNQILIELYTGMRMGEINALKPEDIDFDRSVIKVKRTVSKGLNGRSFIRESTKTENGIREVPINEMVKPILVDALEKAPANKEGLVFYDKSKKGVITTSQVNSTFKRLLKKADITDRGQHALRHTFATRCIEAGVPAIVLRDWMGHANISVTLDTYADVFSGMNNDAMRRFEAHFRDLSK